MIEDSNDDDLYSSSQCATSGCVLMLIADDIAEARAGEAVSVLLGIVTENMFLSAHWRRSEQQ